MKRFLRWFDAHTIPLWIPIVATIAFLAGLGGLYLNHVAQTYPYPFQARPDPSERSVVSSIDPSGCQLCGSPAYEAPCLFNTENGKCYELRIYPPAHGKDPSVISKPSDDSTYGYVSVLAGSAYYGIAIPDENEANISFYTEKLTAYDPNKVKNFVCQECLNKLNKLNPHSYLVFVDLIHTTSNSIPMLDILPNTEFDIRHYHIEMGKVDDYNRLTSFITSSN